MTRSTHTWTAVVLTSLSMLLCGSLAVAQQPGSIGKVAALEGNATVLHRGNLLDAPLALQSPLYPEDMIHTAAASKIKLSLVDGTVLSLGEKSTLHLTTFVYSPKQKTRTSLFSIPEGLFRAVTAKVLPRSKVEVATTTAVAAIRGTDWMGEVTVESSAMVVLKGKVAVSSIHHGVRGKVTLTERMGTTVKGTEPPTTPNKWGEARVNALMKATELP